MKIRTTKEVTDSKFSVLIVVEDLSDEENRKINKFGDPEIEVGGLYGEADSPTSGYVLPTSYEKLKASFEDGVRITFDSGDYEDAEERADTWAEKIKDRIVESITAVRAQNDTFSEESVHNI
jgi:hypothetical protein